MSKYQYPPPQILDGAKRKVIENIEVYTMTEVSDDEERQLRTDLAEILRR